MAEQEACTELVEKATQDQIGTSFEGESQLLPLLQGLLEAPDNEQTADSGTESGEDQRSGLIAEVQNALDKLSLNLRDDAMDITPERRSSLLQLVSKLQAGLAASVPISERRSSVQGRFRRRQRPNRHTVGVSSEELADARRLIEEIHDLTPSQSKISLLQKQNSEGSMVKKSSSSFKPFGPQKSIVKNSVARPFSSSNSTVSGNSSLVQTPTDASESLDFLFNQEITENKPEFLTSTSLDHEHISRSSSGDISIKSIQQSVNQAATIKALSKSPENFLESEETDEDTTVKAQNSKGSDNIKLLNEIHQQLPQPDIVMQTNPIYLQQQNLNLQEKTDKFTAKKIKMKRANTIDIPKPLKFYEDEDDSDSSLPEEDYYQRRRSNYLALRGPIRVGNKNNDKTKLPPFEPKTDNDKKFLAFISKHNENSVVKDTCAKISMWAKPETNKTAKVRNNNFGHIRTAFEKVSSTPPQNSARQFWKSADDAVTTNTKYDGPKISKQSARNLQQMFEEKQKQMQKTSSTPIQSDRNIVTGSLKVKAFEPNEKSYRLVPQPLPVNKFSHAPQSAFKPPPKKILPALQISKAEFKPEDKQKDLDSPLFLYSPKPPEYSTKPWATNAGENRVLSLAASKFENIATKPEIITDRPRKLSKGKVFLPLQQKDNEKLTAPSLVKNMELGNNTVKQLSGQYDNVNGKTNEAYATYSTIKYAIPPNENIFNSPPTKSKQHIQSPAQFNSSNQYSSISSQKQNYITSNQQFYQPQNYSYAYPQQNLPHEINQHSNFANKQNYLNKKIQTPQNQNVLQHDSKYVKDQSAVPHDFNNFNNRNEEIDPQYTSTYQYQPQHPTLAKINTYQPQNPTSAKMNTSSNTQQIFNEKLKATETENAAKPKLEPQVSAESLKEYNAVNSRVMIGPVSQQATTVRQKSPMNRDEHDIQAALGLKNSLQKLTLRTDTSPTPANKNLTTNSNSNNIQVPKMGSPIKSPNCLEESHMTNSPQMYYHKNQINEELDVNQRTENTTPSTTSSVSPLEPVLNIQQFNERKPKSLIVSYPEPATQLQKNTSLVRRNNTAEVFQRIISPNSFTYRPKEEPFKSISPKSFSYSSKTGLMNNTVSDSNYTYRNQARSEPVESLEINDNGESIITSKFQIPVINVPQPESSRPPSQIQIMNKADSWNQICKQKQPPQHKPSPRSSPNARTITKSKSSHSLALPKQFEAGMSKDEMAQKRRTMEAFFGSGEKINSPSYDPKPVKRSINRMKTSEKVSTYRHSSGLARSRTLPDIVCPDLLDESNVEKAFDDLFKSSS